MIIHTKTVCTSVGSIYQCENAVLSGCITTLKNKQKLDVLSEGPSLRPYEGPSLETSSFCLFFKVVI